MEQFEKEEVNEKDSTEKETKESIEAEANNKASDEDTDQFESKQSSELKQNCDNELEQLKSDLEESKNGKLRLQADFENYKRRVEKEKESLINYAAEDMVSQLLPVIDNFERALEVKDTEDFKGFYDGVEMIKKQLIDALLKQGVEEIEAKGQPFDPNYHNAVSQLESEEYDSNIVMEVYQKGYKIKDKVIRPSMVVVSK